MDKTKYLKWYELAKVTINDLELIPDRTDRKIMEFVSQLDWLMFTPKFIITREEGTNVDIPNIYFTIDKEDDKMGRMGLVFDNVKSVDRLTNILSGFSTAEKHKLVDAMLGLKDVWDIVVYRKTKDKNHAQSPDYEEAFAKKSNTIDKNIIDEIIKLSARIREDGREKREAMKRRNKFYLETPSITLMQSEFELTEEVFKERVIEVFNILKICLSIKTISQIRKLERGEQKEEIVTKAMKCPNCSIVIQGKVQNYNSALCVHCKKTFSISSEDIAHINEVDLGD